MFSFDAKSVIQMLVDQNIDRSLSIANCKYPLFYSDGIKIDFRVCVDSTFTDSDEYLSETRFVSMIFFGAVSVFYSVSDSSEYFNNKNDDPKNYINSSNHSSCWRTDGFHFLSTLYFELCKKVNPSVAPKSLNSVDFASQIRVSKVSVCWKHTGETNHKEIVSFKIKTEK